MDDEQRLAQGIGQHAGLQPIAIVGMSCRFAPQLSSLESYWDFLVQGRCAVGDLPGDRWADYENSSPEVAAALKKATRRGCFMERIDHFDPGFFGISAREAQSLDPQQRMILELAWEALEHAGIPPLMIKGSEAGVFAAANSFDYGHRMLADLSHIEPWVVNGGMLFGIANRVSYILDLHGPSLVVDTACAGSLTALHLACQSLRDGSTGLALVAAVNLMTFPGLSLALDASGATAADGRCKSFDSAADGYGRGEGAGVLVLKRLEDALRDQDRILALVRGSGVFQDGHSAGMMAPNGEAQELMLHQVYRQAGIPCASVQYVEAHGTGTRLGDKAELTAISRVFGSTRSGGEKCLVGSVKPNIGHLEAGAGIAGLIKAVLALNHGQLPRSLYENLTDEVDWSTSGIEVVSSLRPWPDTGSPRRAGVSCFGVGGTIAHAIIEAAPVTPQARPGAQPLCGTRLFPLSGQAPQNLRHSAARLAHWVQQHPEAALDDIAHTLGQRRAHLPARGALLASNSTELLEALGQMAAGSDSERCFSGSVLAGRGPVWVFSGHGAQWHGMGRELLASQPVFAAELDSLAEVFSAELGYTPREALEQGVFESVESIQATTFALQLALAALWRSLGLEPRAVIGYSTGEIAAAVVAGALDKQSAARFACRRAALYQRLSGQGAMVMVNLPFAEAARRLEGRAQVVAAIAASPSSTVISGTAGEVERLAGEWAEEGLVPRRVASDVAFHSPHIDQVLEDIRQAAGELRCLTPRLPMYNSSLGDPRALAPRDADFWCANSRNPVLFEQAVTAALEDGFELYLEVSSKPIVAHALKETADACGREHVMVCPSLREGRPEYPELLASLARLYCHGADLQWPAPGALLDLPSMGWNHQRYWTTALPVRANLGKGHDPLRHSLLGSHQLVRSAPPCDIWRTRLDFELRPYPGSHPICGVEILPAAALLNSFMQAGTRDGHLPTLRDVVLRTPVAVEGTRDIQIVRQGQQIRLCSRLDDEAVQSEQEREMGWLTHTTASLDWNTELQGPAPEVAAWQVDCPESLEWPQLEPMYRRRGIADYGFRWHIRSLRRGPGRLMATIQAQLGPSQANSWAVVLDAALTSLPLLLPDDDLLRMPAAIASLCARPTPPEIFTLFAELAPRTGERQPIDLLVLDERGELAARIEGLVFMTVDRQDELAHGSSATVFVEDWEICRFEPPTEPLPQLVLLGSDDDAAQRLSLGLRRAGIEHARVRDGAELRLNGQPTLVLVLGSVPADDEALSDAVEANAWRLLQATQQVQRLALEQPSLRLGCVTFGVKAMANRTALAQSPLWGVARIVAGEQPGLWAGLIDIDPAALNSDSTFGLLRGALGHKSEDVLAIGTQACQVLRLQEAVAPGPKGKPQCVPDATYAITGGFGALGLQAAQHLVNQGARRLVLIGRQGLPTRSAWPALQDPQQRLVIDGIRALERQGVTVLPLALDIADTVKVAEALSESALGLPAIRGVVHAAGVFKGGMIEHLQRASLSQVLRAKVTGTLALERAFPPGSLDFLVLFSSSGQLARPSGQAGYAAANAFMDGFARYRAAQDGQRTLSIAWMAWEQLGMSSNIDATLRECAANGLGALSIPTALSSWQLAQDCGAPYAAVFRVQRSADLGQPLPVLSRLLCDAAQEAAQVTSLDPWRAVPDEQLGQWLAQDIQALIAAELRCAPEDINPQRSLVEKGMDSLLSVALRIRLKQRYRIDLPPTLIWNHPTVEAIARYVRQALA